MGSVTGSAVANTVSIGVITIPMMKIWIHPRFAAGVEAAASTGGALCRLYAQVLSYSPVIRKSPTSRQLPPQPCQPRFTF